MDTSQSTSSDAQPQKRVTMRTIAEQLGVTKTTVSLALRGNTAISQQTRDRVVSLAKKLNYRPDPAIAAIAAQRWSGESPERHRVLAYLCNQNTPNRVPQSAYFPGAKKRAEELGYRLEPFFLDDYPSAESVTRVLYSRGIRGIIIPAIQNPSSKRAMHLDWNKFSAVCCGIGRVRPPLHTVTSDVFATTRLVWEIVARAGNKRVGAALFCHDPIADDDWQRIGATTAAMRFLSINGSEEIPIHTANIHDEASLMQWYEKYKPELVVGFNHSIGEHLEQHGVRIPEDVEFVCLATPPNLKWSGIIHHNEQMGRASIDILNSEMRDNRWGLPPVPNITLMQPEWNQGETFHSTPLRQGEALSPPHVSISNSVTSELAKA